MKYAFVTTNLLDMWNQPQFNGERLSQLFFAEIVELRAVRKGFVRAVQADGYSGWLDQRFLQPLSQRQAVSARRRVNCAVSAKTTRLADPPHLLYYGTQLWCRRRSRDDAICELPDGSTVRLKRNSLKPISGIKTRKVAGADIVREAKRFLGVPYVWGGISPAGFDCSGLVKTILGSFGIYYPRDTKDQIKVGEKVARDKIRTGDLIFFNRHVGIAIGRNRIVHSSIGGSGVRINSLKPGVGDYRGDLDRDYNVARRIL